MRGSLFTVIIGQSGAFVNPGPIAFFCQFLTSACPCRLWIYVFSRILRHIVNSYFEVTVASEAVSGVTYVSYMLSLIYQVADIYKYGAAV